MKWSNVQLIYLREVRDQLRDRRTLFTIAILPIFLYPLLGMIFLQVSQFSREYPALIHVVGKDHLPQMPPLLDGERFFSELFDDPQGSELLVVQNFPDHESLDGSRLRQKAEQSVRDGHCDAVLIVPNTFGAQLNEFRSQLADATTDDTATPKEVHKVVGPHILFDQARDESRIARDRLARVLRQWREQVGQDYMVQSDIPVAAIRPFEPQLTDVAPESKKRAALWSKMLPFVVLIWALTGAFYPAIDLCAGEKERGTLETLLCSPAQRHEIVWGKLLTIMTFSMVTALLNLASMGLTASLMMQQLQAFQLALSDLPMGMPPLISLGWLILALIPVSSLFSALSLALAALARSAKEGQYYLMPMLLVTMPLMILPSLPSIQLELGTSLIPVTGLMLLLRALMESDYAIAALYFLPVLGVTAACCLLAMRWAVDQFNNESVLFRESERFDLRAWLWHLIRDRQDTPTVNQAIFCAIAILMLRFLVGFQISLPENWISLATLTVLTQFAFFALPAGLMALVLTRKPRESLLLRWPRWSSLPAAVLLAILLHPSAIALSVFIQQTYPLPEQIEHISRNLIGGAPNLLTLLLVIAVVPAICEELAFRGFILSGLRHLGHRWWAIMLSSLFFGVAHGIVQQSFSATLIGMIIGYVAVQSGSLLVCILFHVTHNSLAILSQTLLLQYAPHVPGSEWLFELTDAGIVYSWPLVGVSLVMALGVVQWFRMLPHQLYTEERLQKALAHQSARLTS